MRNYSKINNLFLPVLNTYYIIIDDCGLRDVNLVGFTSLFIDEFTYDALREKTENIKDKYNIQELHASNIKKQNIKKYKKVCNELLELLVKELEKANYRYFYNRLCTWSEQNTNLASLKERLANILSMGVVSNNSKIKTISEIASYVLLPILEIINHKKINQDNDTKLILLIDNKYKYDKQLSEYVAIHGIYLGK